MPSTIDIRAREIIGLRKALKKLQEQLTEIDTAASANDEVLLVLHKLAILLIENGKQLRAAEKLLKRGLKLAACHIVVFDNDEHALQAMVAKLSKSGEVASVPPDERFLSPRGQEYFHLPLRKDKKNIGLLVLCSGRKGFFPDDASRDFVLRLGQLLAAVL